MKPEKVRTSTASRLRFRRKIRERRKYTCRHTRGLRNAKGPSNFKLHNCRALFASCVLRVSCVYFDFLKWCMGILVYRVFFIPANRETAFLHAISSAAITYEITLQCARRKIPGCGCAETEKPSQVDNSNWKWGGCGDNIKFGKKAAKRFMDKLENGNDARTAFNLHNNEVGRRVSQLPCFPVLFLTLLTLSLPRGSLLTSKIVWR